jgi:hypothetical protein
MMKSPFKADFKGADFENYDKMYSTGTWSYPLLRSLISPDVILLPIRPAYTVKLNTTESLLDLQVRSCVNGAHILASIKNIHILLNLGASQGISVFVLDIKNVFQNTIQSCPSKRTYKMLPQFFLEYLRLHQLYALQNFRSMQGEKDAGRHWCDLLAGFLCNVGLHRSVADHAIFTWKEHSSLMFVAIATGDFPCVCNDSKHFLCLKRRLKEVFVLTLQEGNIL